MKPRQLAGIGISALIVIAANTPAFRSISSFPDYVRLGEDSVLEVSLDLPLPLYVRPSKPGVLRLNGETLAGPDWKMVDGELAIEPVKVGQTRLDIRVFGVIPLKHTVFEVLPRVEVVPGGHSIGVLLGGTGVVVTGYAPVDTGSGMTVPARDAGISVGDRILEVEGEEVKAAQRVAALIDGYGRLGRIVNLAVEKGAVRKQVQVTPLYDRPTGRYRIGLLVKDGTAGVGTLSFYDPGTGRYAALGHVITEGQGGKPVSVVGGVIVSAAVAGIEKAQGGQPGEKIGTFLEERDVIGTIEQNTEFGIVGTLNAPVANRLYPGPIPVARMSEVREGPAELVTVLDGNALEKFEIEIARVIRQDRPDSKGLIIRVTDQELLRRTGGIVQGMSGSPIIQDGKLVGAVTHVFVNDPSRGYGVFAEWMISGTAAWPVRKAS